MHEGVSVIGPPSTRTGGGLHHVVSKATRKGVSVLPVLSYKSTLDDAIVVQVFGINISPSLHRPDGPEPEDPAEGHIQQLADPHNSYLAESLQEVEASLPVRSADVGRKYAVREIKLGHG